MDFTQDYAWSGCNYTCPPGLPTIGTTNGGARNIFPPNKGKADAKAAMNRDFGDRWFNKPFFQGSMVYNIEPLMQFDHRRSTFPNATAQPKLKTPRVARPGYYNELERDLYGWGPDQRPRTVPVVIPLPGYKKAYRGTTKLSPYGDSEYQYTPYDFRPVTSHIRD